MEIPTTQQLKKKKVVELRAELSKLGLPQGGIKDELIKRLRAHYKEIANEETSATEDETTEEKNNAQTPTEPPSAVDEQKHTAPAQETAPIDKLAPTQEAVGTDELGPASQPLPIDETTHRNEPAPADEPTPIDKKQAPTDEVVPTEETPPIDKSLPTAAEITQNAGETRQDEVMETGSLEPTDQMEVDTVATVRPETMDISQRMDTQSNEPSTSQDQPPGVEDNRPSTELAVTEMKSSEPLISAQPAATMATVDESSVAMPTVVEPPTAEQPPTSDYYSAAESPSDGVKSVEAVRAKTQEPAKEGSQEGTEEKGKKKKKKKRRRRKHEQPQPTPTNADVSTSKENDVEIEYVQEDILQPDDPNYHQFHKIFEAFKLAEIPEKPKDPNSVSALVAKAAEASKKLAAQQRYRVPQEEEEDEEEKEPVVMTKKKLRKLNRLTVAQLKQLVDRPDVVEMHDVTALDPKLLIHLKSTRNTVPVPRHWCFKRKYLQGKRGIEKPPFNLPDFIKATGVMEMRETLEEKEDAKSLKQKARERVRPKMGKLTIDYQKLHDAFFKWQTKPKMSSHGDLYYEGKEFETRLRQKKPGDLSDELRRSLGMPVGMGKHKFPPPWLVAMQRYGPPPSYPHLKIPGLNAPIPEGCSFGYFVGGWGKPPVDETGRPLYGDVFGQDSGEGGGVTNEEDDTLDRGLWGELESEEEESAEESSEDEEESPKPEDIQAGLVTPMEGLVTPSGLTSIPAGLETPEMIQLRKKKIEEAMEAGGETPTLYTVLPEKTSAVGGAMMGSSHVYDLGSTVSGNIRKSGGPGGEGVEVALDPSELDLDAATMTARYEEQMKEKNVLQKEDLSDMVAEHAAKQKKRKRAAADSGGKVSKKLKEFKF